MVNVLVNNDDLTVVGSLDVVEVQLDIGSKGDRGTNIYVGNGLPNSETLAGVTTIPGDLYINTVNSYMYKLSGDAIPVWESIYKIGEVSYSNSYSVDFEDGVGSVSIPFANIFADEANLSVTASQIIVQCEVVGTGKPCAVSLTKTIVTNVDETKNLDIDINAVEFNMTTLAASLLDATGVAVDLTVTLVEGA